MFPLSSKPSYLTTCDTIVLTSATLAVAGGFEFAEERLGLKHARTLIVESPFDYQKQALLYVRAASARSPQSGIYRSGLGRNRAPS